MLPAKASTPESACGLRPVTWDLGPCSIRAKKYTDASPSVAASVYIRTSCEYQRLYGEMATSRAAMTPTAPPSPLPPDPRRGGRGGGGGGERGTEGVRGEVARHAIHKRDEQHTEKEREERGGEF